MTSKYLYIICMVPIGQLFSSPARSEILMTFHKVTLELGLRQVARLSNVHPHSAERVLKDLCREKLVKRRTSGARVFFKRNDRHPDWSIIDAACDGIDRAYAAQRARELQPRALMLLPFMEQGLARVKAAKASMSQGKKKRSSK